MLQLFCSLSFALNLFCIVLCLQSYCSYTNFMNALKFHCSYIFCIHLNHFSSMFRSSHILYFCFSFVKLYGYFLVCRLFDLGHTYRSWKIKKIKKNISNKLLELILLLIIFILLLFLWLLLLYFMRNLSSNAS